MVTVPLCTCSERGEPDWNSVHDDGCPWRKPDTISVPLFTDDFDRLDQALHVLDERLGGAYPDIAELRDRLKRARLLP